MKSKTIILVVVIVLAIVGAFFWYEKTNAPATETVSTLASDYKNATYEIDGKSVTLINGNAETDIVPGSASKLTTKYFGNEASGDFNNDGTQDVSFLLTQNSGGSGTFYYVVTALKMPGGYRGTNAILLGDRIAPQTTEFRDGEIIVNYAERRPDEPMTAQPSIGVSKYLRVENGVLVDTGK